MKKTLLALAACMALSGCSATMGGLAAIGAAVTGFVSSSSASPDYTKYADICKAVSTDITAVRTQYYTTLQSAFNSKNQTVQGGALVMLAVSKNDDNALFGRCMLQGPESFLQTLFKNTNVAQIMLALYQENRADSRSQRQMQLQKELGLARMDHDENMKDKENDLLKSLSGNPTENFKAGADAASSSVPAGVE